MRDFQLIGICGPAGVGRKTTATILGVESGYRLLGFADPIWEAVVRAVPSWDAWHIGEGKDIVDPAVGFAPRHLARVIGDHGRAMQWDLYIRKCARRVAQLIEIGEPGAVIHDLRTQLEAEWLRQEGGTLVHVQRAGVEFRADHETEMGVTADPSDCVIRNPGTISGLRDELLDVLVTLRRCAVT